VALHQIADRVDRDAGFAEGQRRDESRVACLDPLLIRSPDEPERGDEVFGDAILRDPREARPVKRSLNHEINIIEQERAIDGDRERLGALVELPFVDTFATVPEADAPMVQHVSRRRRLRV
jgi:hypothetical protein